jgi:hypothetical protein
MNSKNTFKQAVIKQAVKGGVSHREATKQVEASFRFYPSSEQEVYEHCDCPECLCGNHTKIEYSAEQYGATVNEMTFGGDEYGDYQMWPTTTNNGTIAATAHIRKF